MDNIYFPSYNRWDNVMAYEYLGCGQIIIPESQYPRYRKRYSNLITIPDSRDGRVSKKRNAVLDTIQERHEDGYGWMIDDDFDLLMRKKERIKYTGAECLEHFERLEVMARDMGATLAGFDYSQDNIKLKDFQPFSFTKPVYQVLLVKANDGIRFDERFPTMNEDVDYYIAKMNKNRFMLRDNQYVTVTGTKDGGADSVIGYDKKEQQKWADFLNKKWGFGAMVWNKTRFEFKIPIKGP